MLNFNRLTVAFGFLDVLAVLSKILERSHLAYKRLVAYWSAQLSNFVEFVRGCLYFSFLCERKVAE